MKKSALLIIGGVSCLVLCVFVSLTILIFGIIVKDSDSDNQENDTSFTDSKSEDDRKSNESSSETLHNCLFSSKDNVEKISGYKFELVVSDISDENVGWGETRPDNGVREINLKDYKSGISDNSIYFSAKKHDDSILEDFDMSIQACDPNNKTVAFGYLLDKKSTPYTHDSNRGQSYLSTLELSSYYIKDNSDKYRLDALVYYNGEWRLVDRIDQIEFK